MVVYVIYTMLERCYWFMGLLVLLGCAAALYSVCWETFQYLHFLGRGRASNVESAPPSLSVRCHYRIYELAVKWDVGRTATVIAEGMFFKHTSMNLVNSVSLQFSSRLKYFNSYGMDHQPYCRKLHHPTKMIIFDFGYQLTFPLRTFSLSFFLSLLSFLLSSEIPPSPWYVLQMFMMPRGWFLTTLSFSIISKDLRYTLTKWTSICTFVFPTA